jgi:hypothetical protein
MFLQNTLRDIETIHLVTSVAMFSLNDNYHGRGLYNGRKRALASNIIIGSYQGDCSTWHKSKLMAYADDVARYIMQWDRLEILCNEAFETGYKETVHAARAEVALVVLKGLRERGLLKGDLWHLNDEYSRQELIAELKILMASFDSPEVTVAESSPNKTQAAKRTKTVKKKPKQKNVNARLSELKDLHTKGLITKAVYEKKQQAILEDL